MFLHISTRFGGHRWYPYIRTVGLCVKTAIFLWWKCLCVPDYTYIKSMFLKFIQMNLYNISPMQCSKLRAVPWSEIDTAPFKRDVAAWKRLGCPQHMQQTWWQIVATPFTGFRVLEKKLYIVNCYTCSMRERLSLSAFWGTEDIGVHIVHISRVIITYT